MEFIGNAKVVRKSQLPQIGKSHDFHKDLICIELKISEFNDGYIVYKAKFCEENSLDILDDLFVNCCTYEYAIKYL